MGLIGAAAGAATGSGKREGWFSDLISDAVARGQFVLGAETRNAQETAYARAAIKDSVSK